MTGTVNGNVICLREEVEIIPLPLSRARRMAMIYEIALGRRLERRWIMPWIQPCSQWPRRKAM